MKRHSSKYTTNPNLPRKEAKFGSRRVMDDEPPVYDTFTQNTPASSNSFRATSSAASHNTEPTNTATASTTTTITKDENDKTMVDETLRDLYSPTGKGEGRLTLSSDGPELKVAWAVFQKSFRSRLYGTNVFEAPKKKVRFASDADLATVLNADEKGERENSECSFDDENQEIL
ncbi:hypothetical protein CC80DRAFT_588231 [Byssothecium circinans]|uniref:Uncharacterized protein n=1 Tax=Byssothecium circinans TaxID=147558 RepID=A0A6A5UD79_9PLEO|nr:hypothetical protein CC80DRAFT_588231 [Byssothecium circinans]